MSASRIMTLALFFVLALTGAALGESGEAAPPSHPLFRVKATSLPERIDAFSAMFMGREYADDSSLGDGAHGEFDRNPLVRFDKFHCVTFLETVMALSLSNTVSEFEQTLKHIRYRGDSIRFEERNHFPCLDWIPNNIRRGFVEDITSEVAGNQPLALATAIINRRAWYAFMTIDRIERPDLTLPERLKLLDTLHARGKKYKPVKAQLKYIPFEVLFPHERLKASIDDESLDNETPEARAKLAPANEALFRRIPSGAIVNIVRPNWNVTKVIGTHMNVSHQGFLFWKNGELLIRHAKREPNHKVAEEPFLDYLRRAMLRKSVDGIHLLRIRKPG